MLTGCSNEGGADFDISANCQGASANLFAQVCVPDWSQATDNNSPLTGRSII